MMPSLRVLAVILLAASSARAQSTETFRSWNQPVEPYRIMGPLYYVGASDITAFLLATPEGYVLINSGFEETPPLIEASVRKLGFRFEDVKVLLTSHVHFDHAAGHARIRERTGAKVMVMEGDDDILAGGGKGDFRFDGEYSFPPCPVDRVLHDGDTVALGGVTLTARRTPGHTKGCTTWTIDLAEGGRTYQAVVICSMTINPGVRLVGNPRYPAIAEDYARTFRILEGLQGEVFLGAHASLYDGAGKAQRLRAGERPNPFVDPAGYRRAVREARGRFEAQLAREKGEAAAAPPAVGRVLTDVPSPADPQGRYVLYLHGRILEEQGRQAVSPDFGRYEYDAVLRALADRGFTVIGEVRPRGTGPEYPRRVAGQVRRLLEAGVPPENVTVLGASKGGWLTLLTAAELGRDEVRYAVLAGCGRDTVDLGPRLRGRILSVYDEKDRFRPSCEATFEQAPRLRGRKEVVVHTGLDHVLLYTPRPEWLDPVTEWIRAGPASP
jgi:metallo-beta-lactamase class B